MITSKYVYEEKWIINNFAEHMGRSSIALFLHVLLVIMIESKPIFNE